MENITPDSTNRVFNLAVELVNQSSRNIFLTGKAGTGKTTFLRHIRKNCSKEIAVVAPTGVAAINAGGVTIHSFFQLPISPFIPESNAFNENGKEIADKHSLINRLRFNSDRRKVLQQLELLIIDEISMVRCDTLDAIDTVLRHIRQRPHDPFGGVQVLFIGDMFQLPPVVPNAEWNILSSFYNSPYFFDSRVMRDKPAVYIEFDKIYRQSDELFIKALNQVRNNRLDEEGLQILDSRFQPAFQRGRDSGYIILTTHNAKADDINLIELQKLTGQKYFFDAIIEGDFPEKAYPAESSLELKIGAQVMFIRNDMDKSRRYFNGKIGTVMEIEDEKILVLCKGDPDAIEVSRHEWKNVRYTLNNSSRQIDEEEMGSFTQYPLRLAWAITIHKSQGLTFEKAIIDAGEAFAPGQVYVALSRCTNLEGMILKSKVRAHGLFSDKRIVEFAQTAASSDALQKEVELSRNSYRLFLLQNHFDFKQIGENAQLIQDYIIEHNGSFNDKALPWIGKLADQVSAIQQVAGKFGIQLAQLFQQVEGEEDVLQQRIDAAVNYFIPHISGLLNFMRQCSISTDSRLHAKEINELIRDMSAGLSLKKEVLSSFKDNFEIEKYQAARKSFTSPPFSINVYAALAGQEIESPHPQLYQQLRKERDSICSKKNLQVYMVAGSKTLGELARYLPQSLEEMEKINGLGKIKVQNFGQQFLDIIVGYSEQQGLSSLIHEKSPKKEKKESNKGRPPKGSTRDESFRLFREGWSVAEIAKERSLTVQTIESHLTGFVELGEIEIDELVSKEKQKQIEPLLQEHTTGTLSFIKEKLGNEISFGEIRYVIAWRQYVAGKNDG